MENLANANLTEALVAPKTRAEALRSPQAKQWREAELVELETLKVNNTWKQVDTVKGRKPITCRWVYVIKLNPDNTVKQYKARLCARGFQQQAGIDYDATFSAVARMKSFRIICALSSLMGLTITQLDVTGAFLYSKIDKEIHMTHPPGYKGLAGTVLLLLKTLYGLKQAGRSWYIMLKRILLALGFAVLLSDVCVFRHTKYLMFLSIHVDDFLLATNDENARKYVVRGLAKSFAIKDMGLVSFYLGIHVERKFGKYKMHQGAYIARMIERFGMQGCSPTQTPANSSCILSTDMQPATPLEIAEMAKKPYRSIVGSELYASRATRVDCAQSVRAIGKYNQNPGRQHWQAAKRVLRYMSANPTLGISFPADKGIDIHGFCDASFGDDLDTRRSTEGYVILLAGGPVMWGSRTQSTVTLSSCESEFCALATIVSQICWLIQFLRELKVDFELPIPVFMDNQAAMGLAQNPVKHQRTKHMDIKYFFLREKIEQGLIVLKYVNTLDNVADIFTKPTPPPVFRKLVASLMS
jgi:hypothetical protein